MWTYSSTLLVCILLPLFGTGEGDFFIMRNVIIKACKTMEENTFKISCAQCGYSLEGIQHGGMTQLGIKSLQYENRECPKCRCSDWVADTNFVSPPNKYSADHPYPDGK